MVNMKLEYIKAVLALSKSKSFGEAAENVFSTQSSLSKQIISVEKELGIKLIHRATKKDSIRLTHEGEIFVKHAAGIVEEYNALLDSCICGDVGICWNDWMEKSEVTENS